LTQAVILYIMVQIPVYFSSEAVQSHKEKKTMNENDKKLEKAKKIAKNKISFIRHFITYISVVFVLAVINNIFSRGSQWWLFVALIWGVFVFFNFLSAYVFKGGGLKKLEEDLVKKEMEKMGGKSDEQ
jgi:uncharacterized membrane protein YdbT with pleckstrin-like domain